MDAATMLASDFATLSDLLRAQAQERPDKPALIFGERSLDYAALDALLDRVATALQRDGVGPGGAVAIVAATSIEYALVFLGALRAGGVAAPIQPSVTSEQIAAMIADCAAPILFVDAAAEAALAGKVGSVRQVRLDTPAFAAWLAREGAVPGRVERGPDDPFNIIYSSGTTGTPKGIVQPHAMRWAHVARATAGFDQAVTMVTTPLYSNTTLVSFIPTLAWGGTVVLTEKFDPRSYLAAAERHRATHTMLVPVQYQRIMALPDFDRFDLTSFRYKTCTSAPFSAELKADIVARWPGVLVEFYGMTEGGGTCALNCSAHPDKLHTVGQPLPGHDVRLIDDEGREVPRGAIGEVVGRSPAMMSGYHGRAEASSAAEWFDAEGNRYIRHGDLGSFDADGFLTLVGRKKDLIISGGFNIYPSDLEAVLGQHPDVADCAVIGVPSEQWGETPLGFYVGGGDTQAVLAWFNAQVGKTQRLSDLRRIDELPRSAIGKILKRELRDLWEQTK